MTYPLPARLRETRECNGWSRLQLAEYSGITDAAIENIETGRTPRPRIDTVVALAKALGVTVEELVAEQP